MIIKNNDEQRSLYLAFFTFSFHLLFLNFNPVNFEFTFSEGAKYLYDYDKKIVEDYFFNQANTFAFPIIVGIVDKFFFINDTLFSARILSASSYFFIAFGFINLFKFYKIKINCSIFLIFFYLNPLIWTYGHRGIPDLFAASIAIYSFSNILILKNQKNYKNFIYFLLMGLSVCLKPFCLIYLGLIFLVEYKNNFLTTVKKYYFLFLIAILLPVIYFCIIKINFGFYLIPNKFDPEVSFLKGGFFNNFFGYFIFLSIFIFPISFKLEFINKYNFLIILCLILPLSFYFHFLTNSPNTELNFGFLNSVLDVRLIIFFGLLAFFILLLYIKDNYKINFKYLLIVIIYIFILSLTRSSQRYLITILPIVFLFFLIDIKPIKIKAIFFCVAIVHIFINFFISVNFYLNSSINKEIIEYLNKKEIINETSSGPLYAHSQHMFLSKKAKKYIISKDSSNHIKSFERKFFIIKKKFYLNKLN